jgi:signal transduction histidine kinase
LDTTRGEILAPARLAEEQAALRRVATLVARGSSPAEIFRAVADEAVRVLESEAVGLLRFEPDETATLVAQSDTPWDPPPLGTRLALDGENLLTRMHRTRQAARVDDWEGATGAVAGLASVLGVRSAVATPVVVEGHLWGAVIAVTSRSDPLPADMEARIAQFTELVATAIANAAARGELSQLAEEQAALRRVAVLVAQQPSPGEVFTAVTEIVGSLLGADLAVMYVYPGDGTATVVASWTEGAPALATGTRLPLDGDSGVARIFHTAAAARIDGYAGAAGGAAEVARGLRLRSAVGAPILVAGKLWGALTAATRGEEPLPADAETRIAGFTELVATAVSNTQARQDLQRLADEQAALRHVATLVAIQASHGDVFAAIAEGISGVLREELRLVRFEGDRAVVVACSAGPHDHVLAVGSRLPLGGNTVLSQVFRTGEPARMDDYRQASGPIADVVRPSGLRGAVATPIIVEGRRWGAMLVGTFGDEPVPRGIERRLGEFTELMATAIANAEARAEIERLAAEQAALRWVATLVAEGVPQQHLFAQLVREVARVVAAPMVWLIRHEPERVAAVVASAGDDVFPVGSRWPLDGPSATAQDRKAGITSSVAVPITVDGRVWGALRVATSGPEPLPADIGARLSNFTGLVATAISNASARSELVASRARIVSAGDEARRRIERNLHDGTQQRLIALGLDLQAARAAIPAEQGDTHSALARSQQDLEAILADLRELSHGLHPPLLSRLGLGPSLRALARRSPIPVHLDIQVPARPAAAIETAAYYVVSEAVTNAIKHSQASEISVTMTVEAGSLHATIADDGLGGADASDGSGLTGLLDRVDALGGRFALDSPPRTGTTISLELPVEPAVTA